MEYINDIQITGKEKACLLGSMKNFEQLRRTYKKILVANYYRNFLTIMI